ncbi:MAG: hypothetical protein ACLFVG_03165 [Candidatus Aminicenantes bacterium]
MGKETVRHRHLDGFHIRDCPGAFAGKYHRQGALFTESDLTLVGNMGCDPGDELQAIHPFYFFSSFSIPVADLTF